MIKFTESSAGEGKNKGEAQPGTETLSANHLSSVVATPAPAALRLHS